MEVKLWHLVVNAEVLAAWLLLVGAVLAPRRQVRVDQIHDFDNTVRT